ncbi:MAG: hypothetical protein GAK41_01400 [Burkholderia gladioli]|nr:MAG: hypothetical protein GAK41_01400 [Burkholderia gladioli]
MVQAAARAGTLAPATDPRVKRLRADVDRLAPYAVKWNERVKGWHWEVNVVRARTHAHRLPAGRQAAGRQRAAGTAAPEGVVA